MDDKPNRITIELPAGFQEVALLVEAIKLLLDEFGMESFADDESEQDDPLAFDARFISELEREIIVARGGAAKRH